MPRSRRRLAALFLAFAGWLSLAHAEAPTVSRVLRAGVESNSAPCTFSDGDGQATGFSVELLEEVAREQNLTIEFQVLDWSTLLERFKAGQLDLICNVADTPERRSFMDFSATTITMRAAVFVRRDGPRLHRITDLAGLRVATLRNSRSYEYLKNNDVGARLVFRQSLRDCIRAVNEGDADAVISTDAVARYLIRTSGYAEVVVAPVEVPDLVYRDHFGLHPGNPELLAQLNEGLVSVQRRGVYDQLYEKWVGPIVSRPLRLRDALPYVLPLVALLAAGVAGLYWQRRTLGQVRRQAAALRRNEEQLSLVLEGSQDGFWDWDLRSGELIRSERWASMLGYTRGEIAPGRPGFLALIHPDDRVRVEQDEDRLWAGGDQFAIEFRMRTKDGSWRWILDRGKVVKRDPVTGSPWRIAGTHTDITARKRTEEENEKLQRQMLESQKLESLGMLAGGVAHDFNNLLTAILGNASLLQLDLQSDPAKTALLEKILTTTRRAGDLCRQLLAYAGKGAVSVERIDVSRLVRDTTRLLEVSLHGAQLEFDLASDLPPIEGDSSQVRQIVMNLVINAAEAMAGRPGRIRVSTSRVVLVDGDLPDALPGGSPAGGNYVCLQVEDNGPGMTPEVRKRIFDPFFTTKVTGRGLGLAGVIGIVRAQQGALTVDSLTGRGTTFRIFLPTVEGPAAAPTRAPFTGSLPARAGSGTILVADDEPAVRQLAGAILRRVGYDVVLAADGSEALQHFNTEPNRFRAALFDVAMPRLGGIETLREIRARRANFPCVLFSGAGDQVARNELNDNSATSFLQKPFTPESLIELMVRLTK